MKNAPRNSETNLLLGISGFPPESARNCTQELSPIANGEFKESVNGTLMFLETSKRRKYRSTITCQDYNSPFINGIWLGSQVSVGCINNLWQEIPKGETTTQLIRTPTPDSVSAINHWGRHVRFHLEDNEVTLFKPNEQKIFICFRPYLMMLVIDFTILSDEWGNKSGWKLMLEEI